MKAGMDGRVCSAIEHTALSDGKFALSMHKQRKAHRLCDAFDSIKNKLIFSCNFLRFEIIAEARPDVRGNLA